PSLVRWISLHAPIAAAAGPGLVRRCFYLEDKKVPTYAPFLLFDYFCVLIVESLKLV
ncbi:hypothetical protein LINPERPRIM_LOCUS29541, partial [Linum perenne]